MSFSPVENEADLFLLKDFSGAGLSATTSFVFQPQIGCTIVKLVHAIASGNSTSTYSLASVQRSAADIILTGIPTGTAAVVATAAESGKTLKCTAGETLTLKQTFTGTPSSCIGISTQVWAKRDW